uniref:Uncharacterized protein n=1 Tax=Brassica campestris TaxID=3711 RepID=M4D153_BRACM
MRTRRRQADRSNSPNVRVGLHVRSNSLVRRVGRLARSNSPVRRIGWRGR